MTILKGLTLGLAIAPLAISITFAAAGSEPLKGKNTINKPMAMQSNLQQPAIAKESRVIQQKKVKPTSTEAPTDEKYLLHDKRISACWQRINEARASGNTKYMEACETKYETAKHSVLALLPMSDPVISGSDDLTEALSERE